MGKDWKRGIFGGVGELLCGGVLLALATGCSGPPPVEPEASESSGAETTESMPAEETAEVTPAMLRLLPRDATYADLLQRVRQLMAIDPNIEAPGEGCLLRSQGGLSGWRLAGELAPALRPLPEPMSSRRRMPAGAVRVLSRWGQQGSGDAATFVTWTASAPPAAEQAFVLLLRERAGRLQASLRSTVDDLGELEGVQRWEVVRDRLLQENPTQFYVSAEAGLSLSALVEALEAFAAMEVVFVVPLAPGTNLPDAPAPSTAGLCPDGLPPTDSEEGATGTRDATSIRAGLGAFVEQAQGCLAQAGAAGARGGLLQAEVRIEPTGSVGAACIRQDEIGSETLRSCVLGALQGIDFGAASGTTVLRLPLRLAPDRERSQTPLCHE